MQQLTLADAGRTPAVTSSLFSSRYGEMLAAWGDDLLKLDRPVVALTRKGPRLLELAAREGLIPTSLMSRLTTERALVLGVLSAEDRGVVMTDDAVTFGSTFARFSDIARQRYGKEKVYGYPFALNEAIHPDYRDYVHRSKLTLEKDAPVSFVNSEIGAFAMLAKPYDLDHPVLYTTLRPLGWAELEADLFAAALNLGAEVYATPRRVTAASGAMQIRRAWTVLFPGGADDAAAAQFRKVRCYFDPELRRLALVPIAPSTASLLELDRRLLGGSTHLAAAWTLVRDARREPRSDDERVCQQQALVTWANYLLELASLSPHLDTLLRALVASGLSSSVTPALSTDDVRLLVGIDHASAVTSRLERFLAENPRATTDNVRGATTPLVRIPERHRASYETHLRSLVRRASSTEDVLEACFWAQHVGIEVRSRRASPKSLQRLEFGVHVRYLEMLVADRFGRCATVSFHRALDSLIDAGTAVPRFLLDPGSEEPVWFRSFRAGEGLQSLGSLVLHGFRSLQREMRVDAVPAVVLEKHLVYLIQQRNSLHDEALDTAPPTARHWGLYGGRAMIHTGVKPKPLLQWGEDKLLLTRPKDTKKSRQYLEHAGAREQLPEMRLSEQTLHRFDSIARWTADAAATPELSSNFITAAASVETPWAYQQALRAEIAGWSDDLQVVLTSIRERLGQRRILVSPSLLKRVADTANWLAQAEIKHQLFDNWPRLLDAADAHWNNDGGDTASTWRRLIRPVAMQTASEPAPLIPSMQELILVAARFTSLLRNALDELRNNASSKTRTLIDARSDLETAVASCSTLLRDQLTPGIAPLMTADLGRSTDTMWHVIHAGTALTDAADELVADDWIDRHAMETVHDLRFVSLWDIIGSTVTEDEEDENRRRNLLRRVCALALPRRIHGLDPISTNDGHLAVCRTAEDLAWFMQLVVDAHRGYYPVRFGVATVNEAPLHRVVDTGRFSGPTIYRAARQLDLFKELKKDASRWLRAEPPREPAGSYAILSQQAADELSTTALGPSIKEFEGRYRLRTGTSPDSRIWWASLD